MNKPTIDLTSNADIPVKTQLQLILNQVNPQHKRDILNMLSDANNGAISWQQLINDYGEPVGEGTSTLPISSNLDTIYRSIFKMSNLDARANPFLKIEELYDALTDGGIGYNGSDDSSHGLFTNINENTMASLYEIIYNKPMNIDDYRDYLAHGNPDYYQPTEISDLTNDNDESSSNYNFNQNELSPAAINRIVVNDTSNDNEYRELNHIPNDDSLEGMVSPYQSGQAIKYSYNLIQSVLKLPVEMSLQIPIEAALYFANLKINDQLYVKLPKFTKGKITRTKFHSMFRLSQCASVVLRNIIGSSVTTYNSMPTNSIISYLIEAHLNYRHHAMYELCTKTLLELYALCFAVKYSKKFLNYLTVKDVRMIRVNLRYIKNWSTHFSKYRPLIEVWESLDTAVGYLYPYFKSILDTTDLNYSNYKFNDNNLQR